MVMETTRAKTRKMKTFPIERAKNLFIDVESIEKKKRGIKLQSHKFLVLCVFFLCTKSGGGEKVSLKFLRTLQGNF